MCEPEDQRCVLVVDNYITGVSRNDSSVSATHPGVGAASFGGGGIVCANVGGQKTDYCDLGSDDPRRRYLACVFRSA